MWNAICWAALMSFTPSAGNTNYVSPAELVWVHTDLFNCYGGGSSEEENFHTFHTFWSTFNIKIHFTNWGGRRMKVGGAPVWSVCFPEMLKGSYKMLLTTWNENRKWNMTVFLYSRRTKWVRGQSLEGHHRRRWGSIRINLMEGHFQVCILVWNRQEPTSGLSQSVCLRLSLVPHSVHWRHI